MSSPSHLNEELIAHLKNQHLIGRDDIERAFRLTPRHFFLPAVDLQDAYRDRAIATKFEATVAISSCSQPSIVAIMLGQLDLRERQNVLEVGAGTGYNAALISRLVGPAGSVTTVDIDCDTAKLAERNLRVAGVSNASVVCADGGAGYAPAAPYDRIILTVSTSDISPAWLSQLADGGVLVLPLCLGARQYAIAFEKIDGVLRSRSIQPCGFMPLRGDFAGPRIWRTCGDLIVAGELVEQLDLGALSSLLALPPRAQPLQVSELDLADLLDHMAIRLVPVFTLMSSRPRGESTLCFGLQAASGGSVVVMSGGEHGIAKAGGDVMRHGSMAAWHELLAHVDVFVAAGRPSAAHGAIEAGPHGTLPAGPPVLRKRWMDYRFRPLYSV